jgi:hypothetical protein
MSDGARIGLLSALPIYVVAQALHDEWAMKAPDAMKRSGRTGAVWGMGLGILSSGMTNLGKPVSEQVAAEIAMAILGFAIGYGVGWLAKKL